MHPKLQGFRPFEDPRTPLEKMRRTEIANRLMHAKVKGADPTLPKEQLIEIARAAGINPHEIPMLQPVAPQDVKVDVKMPALRKAVQSRGGYEWKQILKMKRPELERIIHGEVAADVR